MLDRNLCKSNQSRGTLRHERVDLEDLSAEPECIALPPTGRPAVGLQRNNARTQTNSRMPMSVGPNGTDTDVAKNPETPLCHRLERRQPSKPRANGRLRPLAGPFRRHSFPRDGPEFLQRIDISTRGTSRLMGPVSRHP